MKNKSGLADFFKTGLLLVPGFLYAVFSLILSSNRLFPAFSAETLMVLNTAQLLSFGVTIAKYASDQMVLSKLQPGEHTAIGYFFLRRVLPISLIFSGAMIFTNGLSSALTLFICIPIEIFCIITILELNIAKKYFKALALSLMGYPLVFTVFIMLCFFQKVNDYSILIIFTIAALVKSLAAFYLRRTKNYRNDILVTSVQVPVQQAGNYMLFRADQLIIASNILRLPFLNIMIPGDYLFYSKMTELFSGISTSMSPVLSKFRKDNSDEISIKPLMKNRLFIVLNLMSITVQTAAYLLFVKETDMLHVLMCVPFALITMLIIPVNMINYEIYRTDNLKLANKLNLMALSIGLALFMLNLFIKSTLMFAFTIPVQLFSFVLLYNFGRRKTTADV